MRKYNYVLEIIMAFFIYDIINYFAFPKDLAFMDMPWHPYWIVILVMASKYGTLAGAITSSVAVGHISYLTMSSISSISDLEEYFEVQGAGLIVAFFPVSLLLGSMRQKYKNKEFQLYEDKFNLNKNLNQCQTSLSSSEEIRNNLERRIVGETSTIKTLYEISKKLSTQDTDQIYITGLNFLERVLKVEKASIYILENDDFILKASRGWSREVEVEARESQESNIMSLAIRENRTITIKDILSMPEANEYISQYNKVLAIFPLRDINNNPIGVLNIEKIDFVSFNTANINLIEVVISMINQAISQANLNNELKKQAIWDYKYNIYKFNYFYNALNREIIRSQQFTTPLSVGFIKIDRFGFINDNTKEILMHAIIEIIKRDLNKTDLIFEYKFEGTFAVIAPMENMKNLEKELQKCADSCLGISNIEKAESKPPQLIFSSCELEDSKQTLEELIEPALKSCKLIMPDFKNSPCFNHSG